MFYQNCSFFIREKVGMAVVKMMLCEPNDVIFVTKLSRADFTASDGVKSL